VNSAVYNPGDVVTVTYHADNTNFAKVTVSGPNGATVANQDTSGNPDVSFTFTAGPPGAYTMVLEAYFYDQLVGTASAQFTVQGGAPPAPPAVTPTLSITTDRAPSGGFYRTGDPITVSFSATPAAVVRVSDTGPGGNKVVVYDPGTPAPNGSFSGNAQAPGPHTLTIEALVNGQPVANATTTYNVLPPNVAITTDRGPNGAYHIGETITISFQIGAPALVRITDTNAAGGSVVVYNPDKPLASGSFSGPASFPGQHTLTLEVIVNGQTAATGTTQYVVVGGS
jgi:hypothetical protein